MKKQCSYGHGRVTCFSVYGGPDLDFSQGDLQPVAGATPACILYVDTFLDGADDVLEAVAIWDAFRPFLESDTFPKVCFSCLLFVLTLFSYKDRG